MVMLTPRSFLLTIYGPASAVLEDLSSGRRVRVDLADLGAQVARWLPSDQRAREDALLDLDGGRVGLDAELVEQDAPAGEELP